MAVDFVRALQLNPAEPIYSQIIDGVKRAVARGELRPGDQIPSQRELAMQVRVNPNTVQRAYREMEGMGLVETLRGRGTFVTGNEALLRGIRDDMARVAMQRFLRELRALGFDGTQIARLTADAVTQPEPHKGGASNDDKHHDDGVGH